MNTKKLMKAGALTLLLGTGTLTVTQGDALAVSCGDTLGPGGKVVLDTDLACANTKALTVVGPITLDLNGHTISCTNSNDAFRTGIVLGGQRAKVRNGIVTGCVDGIRAGGGGQHRISGVTAHNNQTGFNVKSDKNRLDYNTATSNDYFGFAVAGMKNRLDHNIASDNFDSFAVLAAGEKTTLNNNIASNNEARGFADAGKNTILRNNAATQNAAGFVFWLEASGAWASKNIANENGDGFEVFGTSVRLKSNTAMNNESIGIRVDTNAQHQFMANTVLGSGYVDLVDYAPNCGSNVWKSNIFVTSWQICIH